MNIPCYTDILDCILCPGLSCFCLVCVFFLIEVFTTIILNPKQIELA